MTQMKKDQNPHPPPAAFAQGRIVFRAAVLGWAMLGLAVLGWALLAGPARAGLLEDLFAPRAEPWARWQAHDPDGPARPDHRPWTRLLGTYVVPGPDGVARFRYRRVAAEDRATLRAYVAELERTAVSSLNRDVQLAYWINFYNALTVRLILDHYPVASIRDIDISPGWLADGPWDAKLASVEGQAISLNDIEHRILRPLWQDPRVHYAINCASIGCPDLQASAFTGETIGERLDAAARAYVNHPRGARIEKGALILSSLYVWFADDFGGAAGVLRHIKKYARPKLAKALAGIAAIDGHGYDWALNDAGDAAEE